MEKRNKTNILILENTIKYVADHGLENVTTKKVALSMNISEGTVLYHFKNKKILLSECLYYIDNQVDSIFRGIPFFSFSLFKGVQKLWYEYFMYFIEHGDYAKFYSMYRTSSYYNEEVMKEQEKSFNFFVKITKKIMPKLGMNSDIFWPYVIEITLSFAAKIADNKIENTNENIEEIFNIIFFGMNGIIKNHKMEEFK